MSYKDKDKEKEKEYQRKYRENNKEKISERGKEYRERLENKVRDKLYYQKNKERIKAKRKERDTRPEAKAKKKESDKKYSKKNKEKIKVRRKKYQQRPEIKAKAKKYQQRPEVKAKAREKENKRRKKLGLPSVHKMGSEEYKKQISATQQGIDIEDWNGFSKKQYDQNWTLEFRRAIRKRDNQVCMLCGIHREKLTKALDVHHIDYNKLNTTKENCVSLCCSCHSKTQTNREEWKRFFQSLLSKRYGYRYLR